MTKRFKFAATLYAKIAALAADQNGMVLPYVTAMMAILMGLAMLGTDLSRYMDLHSQLQKAADAFALAGAAELDGQAGARARATAAINNLMAGQNSSVWGPGAAAATASTITFFQTLPANNQPLGGTVAGSDATANFVHVVVSPVQITSFIPATIFGGANTVQTQAEAAAGGPAAPGGTTVCNWTPVFICNPLEGTGQQLSTIIGHELQLKLGPGGNGFSPGNYGYLAVNGQGASNLWPTLAAANPPQCLSQNNVTTQTGQVTSADEALNTRFDLYYKTRKNSKNDPAYPPARDVRKGGLGNACNEDPNSPAYLNGYGSPYGMPPGPNPPCNGTGTDGCYQFGQCIQPTGASGLLALAACGLPKDATYNAKGVGDGNWRLFDYWTVNHYQQYGLLAPVLNGVLVNTPWGSGLAGTPTSIAGRYTVYQYELANPAFNNDISYGFKKPPHNPAVPGETGAPQCSSQPVPAGLDGRVLDVAVANCNANPIGGGNTTFRPAEYWQFFLTRPMCRTCQDANDNNVLYGELVGPITPGGVGGGVGGNASPINYNVQLVR
jgi:Putative Flp pilus-assembly TadE/G-like